MTIDRETPDRPDAPGTPKMSVIQGGKGSTAKRKTKTRSAPDIETGLTEKQERFAQEIMAGANYTAAYRAAYVTDDMNDQTVWRKACELAADGKVTARLHELRAQKEAEQRMQGVSRSGFVIAELQKMASDKDIPPAVKVRALELMGKTVALFTDRVETEDTTDRTAEEIEAQIKARLGIA
jgi:phage terminase small subunit